MTHKGHRALPLFPPSALWQIGCLVPGSFLRSLCRMSQLCILQGGFAVPPAGVGTPIDAGSGHTWRVWRCDPGSGFRCACGMGLLCFCYSPGAERAPCSCWSPKEMHGPGRAPVGLSPWIRKKVSGFFCELLRFGGLPVTQYYCSNH